MKTRNSSIGQMLRIALLTSSTGITAMSWSTPALAQDTKAESGEAAIVITGSRIVRRDYTATSPIVTVDTDLIEKSSSVNLEANLNKLPQFAPAITQFGPPEGRGDINSTATNTPGATTVSLRQLGANRNLVLIDGRRPTPINGTGVVDINSIPSAAIERVEIITGGASSTYGADAVGGVVNFILKKNFQGFTVDGQFGLSEKGDGQEYRISSLMGASIDGGRGNVVLGVERYDRKEIKQFDRDAYRRLYSSPDTLGNTIFGFEQTYFLFQTLTGQPAGSGNPGQAALNSMFQAKGAPATLPSGAVNNITGAFGIYLNTDNSLFLNYAAGGAGTNYTPLTTGYNGAIDGVQRKKTAGGLLRDNYVDQMLSTPSNRWSFFAKGNYDITDDITAFTQVSYVRTQVYTRNLVAPAITSWSVLIPHGTGIYAGDASLGIASSLLANGNTNPDYLAGGKYGLNCPAVGGCTNSQVFPTPSELTTLLNSRGVYNTSGVRTTDGSNQPFQINKFLTQVGERYLDNRSTNVQIMAGFNGKVPGTDWTWEIYGSHGESNTKTDQYNFASVLRWRAVLSAPNYGQAFAYRGNGGSLNGAPAGQPGAGFQGATGKCTSGVNPFTTQVWTDDCKAAVTTNLQTENRNTQDVVEANLQGGLFDLPYGQLRFALGADYRKNSIFFHPDGQSTEGTSFLEPVNGIYPQGQTQGDVNVKELYGELLIPLLSDLPLVKSLNLELGYRMSSYSISTVGTVGTFKINGDYAPFNWLRFRGGYQKASRAPNLAELYTAATSTLAPPGTSNDGDPCSRANPTSPIAGQNYSANPLGFTSELVADPTDTTGNPDAAKVEALCRQIMGSDGATVYYAPNRVYNAGATGFDFPTLVGNPNLTQEDATTYTIGAVITSPFESPWLRRFSLAIDYYNVELSNAISQQGASGIYRRCFAKVYNPTFTMNEWCARIHRTPGTGESANIDITYSNAGRVKTSGIDVQMTWGVNLKDIGLGLPGMFTESVQASYLMDFSTTTDDGIVPMVDYSGSLGGGQVGTNPGAYRWKVFTTWGYAVGPVTASLQWQFKSAAASTLSRTDPSSNTTGAPSYSLFNLGGTVAIMRNAIVRFGVDNLFNKQPPVLNINLLANNQTALKGGNYDPTNYDVLGRRFYIGANIKF